LECFEARAADSKPIQNIHTAVNASKFEKLGTSCFYVEDGASCKNCTVLILIKDNNQWGNVNQVKRQTFSIINSAFPGKIIYFNLYLTVKRLENQVLSSIKNIKNAGLFLSDPVLLDNCLLTNLPSTMGNVSLAFMAAMPLSQVLIYNTASGLQLGHFDKQNKQVVCLKCRPGENLLLAINSTVIPFNTRSDYSLGNLDLSICQYSICKTAFSFCSH